MDNEQRDRLELMRELVSEAERAMTSLHSLTHEGLHTVDNHSATQAEDLQMVSQQAGTVVQAMTEVAEMARHARSYQAQAHHETQPGRVPE